MIINKLMAIQKEIQLKVDEPNFPHKNQKIIAVSKTFPISDIQPLINYGHIHYGENKVQEALEKWQIIKVDHKELKLHMIGKLQSNKVKQALTLFDYIHSLDNLKLAKKISTEQIKIKKNIKIFIQVNIGSEDQKNGIHPKDIKEFYNVCVNDLGLDVIGLMCLPPNNINSALYFSQMKLLNQQVGTNELSMGMSNDYMEALKYGSTFLRIGSKIFGKRD